MHNLKVMWFKVVLLALSLSLLELGAAQECEGVGGVLGMTLENVLDVAIEKLNSTVEKIVDVAVERRLATALQVIANISNSIEQLVSSHPNGPKYCRFTNICNGHI